MLKRIIDVDKEYKLSPLKAIRKFFSVHKDLDYWEETLIYMYENGLNHLDDTILNDGTYNHNWLYSIWLYINGDYTYIAVIERG